MPDGLGLAAALDALNNVGIVALCLVLVYLFITDRIVSGKRLRKAETDRDKWEGIALDAIRASSSAILPAAEAVHHLVTNLPDPGADTNAEGGSP